MSYESELEERIAKAKEYIEVGKSYTVNYQFPASHPSRKKMHIRAIVDDEAIVYRVWSGRKQCWCYDTTEFFYIVLQLEDNRIKKG